MVAVCAAAELTPAEAELRALRQNGDIIAARMRIDEARGRLRQAGVRPNPEIHIETQHVGRFREGYITAGWMQKFPGAAKLRLEKEVSQGLLDAAFAEVLVAERALILQVRTHAVKLLALVSQDELRSKQAANANELSEAAASRAEKGEGSSLEAAQFELEAQQLQLDALKAETVRAESLGELRKLLALPASEALSIKGRLEAPHMMVVTPAAESRPEYLAAQKQESAALRAVELEKARKRDDISAGPYLGFQRSEDAPDGSANESLIGIRFSIPLPFFSKNEGKIQEAEAHAARLEAERKALAQHIIADNAAAKARLQTLARLIHEINSTLLPKAEELEMKLRDAYDKGLLPNTSDVLRAREKRLQFEHSRLDALRDFHLLLASMGLRDGGRP